MRCSNCVNSIPDGSAFCPHCGTNLNGASISSRPASSFSLNIIWIIAPILLFAVFVVCNIVTLRSIGRLTAHHSENVLSVTAGTDTTHDGGSAAAGSAIPGISDVKLLGTWSRGGPTGEMVDPSTGFSAGAIYSGEWYLFKEDGTFRYVIVGSGSVISGGAVWEGKFEVKRGDLLLSAIRESWYPNPASPGQKKGYTNKKLDDKTQKYRYDAGSDKLIINGEAFSRARK